MFLNIFELEEIRDLFEKYAYLFIGRQQTSVDFFNAKEISFLKTKRF